MLLALERHFVDYILNTIYENPRIIYGVVAEGAT
jgi:hypothetical protein